ncbi:MAG: 3-phosphoshikimate 1-carboxyvinyltransferase [Candidatus Omnitrophica bacterium]|nr:3-phosphoshikimate 1-carboxyvinyltransferase [Candidatus Omnitrophota bacterium]MCM8803113.1 3-phosphoshikimate 1-carboxyvinyltransferase [Candidatus Omnitrophota bacterium]
MDIIVEKNSRLKGEIEVPGDKSISHRALIFGSISEGRTEISNISKSIDCLSTLNCLKNLGIKIEEKQDLVTVQGDELKEPKNILDCGNSGTTMRLLSGVLSGQPFYSVLTGDSSLRNRPMDRIIKPLKMMGGEIYGRENNRFPPLTIIGKKLSGINFKMEVASAQVKSCIILATLFANGYTRIEEPYQTRDHTERMLKFFNGEIEIRENKIFVIGNQKLKGREIYIPGDFSSACYFIAGSLLIPESEILIKNVGLNPTRTGFLKIIERMGGKFEILNKKEICNEPIGDIRIYYTKKLNGVEIYPEEVPNIIDEIPLIAVLGSVSRGKTIVSGAKELRVKESDRIKSITTELKKMKANIEEKEDGFIIEGVDRLDGAIVDSWDDHRIAMSLFIAGLIADGKTVLKNAGCVKISFPEFFDKFKGLGVYFEISDQKGE